CLVSPNWTMLLPGHPYDGDDPDGYLARDGIVAYLERYAAALDAPVREGVTVEAVAVDDAGFSLRTSHGALRAGSVVLATGAYQRPHRPAGAGTLPPGLHVIDVEGYASPQALPDGRALILGAGQSGCQLGE